MRKRVKCVTVGCYNKAEKDDERCGICIEGHYRAIWSKNFAYNGARSSKHTLDSLDDLQDQVS